MNLFAYWRQQRFNRQWDRAALETALALGHPRKFGDDWYLTTIAGHEHGRFTGHVWAKLELP